MLISSLPFPSTSNRLVSPNFRVVLMNSDFTIRVASLLRRASILTECEFPLSIYRSVSPIAPTKDIFPSVKFVDVLGAAPPPPPPPPPPPLLDEEDELPPHDAAKAGLASLQSEPGEHPVPYPSPSPSWHCSRTPE